MYQKISYISLWFLNNEKNISITEFKTSTKKWSFFVRDEQTEDMLDDILGANQVKYNELPISTEQKQSEKN